MTTDKTRENRLRRAAERQGYHLIKARSRDAMHGIYTLVTHGGLGGRGYTFQDLDQMENWLKGGPGQIGSRALATWRSMVETGQATVRLANARFRHGIGRDGWTIGGRLLRVCGREDCDRMDFDDGDPRCAHCRGEDDAIDFN